MQMEHTLVALLAGSIACTLNLVGDRVDGVPKMV